jgi:hypothetical protein
VNGSRKQRLLRGVAAILPLRLLPVDALLRGCQWLSARVAGLLFLRDWQLEAQGRPQFFKHEINLSRWPREPERWSFAARGVYAREAMFRGCKVLDLCCGDGSCSYLFFSDIAGRIDAVDNDAGSIAYAGRYHSAPNITYRKLDVLAQALPGDDYDFVVWNAAICYFSMAEIRQVLGKIVAAGKAGMQLRGMLPRANGWVDHKTEFADCAAVEDLLREYFAVVTLREVDEGSAVSLYFQASQPLRESRAQQG